MTDQAETRPLRLLSLDGGGVKGLTSLIILDGIFKEVERLERRKVLPCEYFDLIGGTSTGG
jgi:patatin-like phospholipase/acyl hydrolase